ncbi:unnamed protein product [Chondrus crispus]|uniref:Uncharacterized protein n=1 Tax=Chondrus crispus TaxID=2769 RepID=R7Q919_CHOCR|nr:unnamed protein product [Chondrus crispus]CDF33965.1 unnamed protein product [Chondrus crispus]|eukprot:XP_005713784.1 unnamed protein product [Chondrus crispus]
MLDYCDEFLCPLSGHKSLAPPIL